MKYLTIKFPCVLGTSGAGLWSPVSKDVPVEYLELVLFGDEDFGELRVFFDTKTWNVREDGLIYTDPEFLYNLHEELEEYDLPIDDVSYSEQGMQGYDYVSLDVGKNFIEAFKALKQKGK